MKTENLKVGDVLIAISNGSIDECYTKGKEYEVTRIVGKKWFFENDFGAEDWGNTDVVFEYFTLKEAPKGEHIGYIAPMDYFFWAIKRGDIIKQTQSVNTTYLINTFPIPKELIESWEKYYEPVEDKVTIGGMEVRFSNCPIINNSTFSNKRLKTILEWAKSEPNLAEKLELIINKMEK